MGPGRKDLAHDSHIGLIRHLDSCSKPCQASSNHHNIMRENHTEPIIRPLCKVFEEYLPDMSK
jgi:hypothetical protein